MKYLLLLLSLIFLVACETIPAAQPTVEPTPEPIIIEIPVEVVTPTPTVTIPTFTPTVVDSYESVPTATPTVEPTPTATPTPEPTPIRRSVLPDKLKEVIESTPIPEYVGTIPIGPKPDGIGIAEEDIVPFYKSMGGISNGRINEDKGIRTLEITGVKEGVVIILGGPSDLERDLDMAAFMFYMPQMESAPISHLIVFLSKILDGTSYAIKDWLADNVSYVRLQVNNVTYEEDWWRINLEQLDDGISVMYVTPLYEE